MSSDPDYAGDPEFSRLLRREPAINLQRVALEIARDEYPELDVDRYMNWFDEAARPLKPLVWKAETEADALQIISHAMADERGFYGTSEAFRDPRCSYLNRVIDTGRGLPITLSLVYMGVAARLGLDLSGVASPMHFVARLETADGPLFVDAFTHGKILTEPQCLTWLTRVSDLPEHIIVKSLGPAEPRLIVMRMLNNLKALYAQHEQWTSLWRVQQRLCALQPGNWQERRDLGMVSLQAHRPGLALNLLTECLESCRDETEEEAMHHAVDQAKTFLAWMN